MFFPTPIQLQMLPQFEKRKRKQAIIDSRRICVTYLRRNYQTYNYQFSENCQEKRKNRERYKGSVQKAIHDEIFCQSTITQVNLSRKSISLYLCS
jgi:hypothetical protein